MASNQFKVLVGVKVNPKGVQAQLNKIKGKKITLSLDTKSAKSKISTVEKQIKNLNKIKVNLDLKLSDAFGDIQKLLSSYKEINAEIKKMKALSKSGGGFSEELSDAKKLGSIYKELSRLKTSIGNIHSNAGSKAVAKDVENFKNKAEEALNQYNKLKTKLNNGTLSSKDLDKLSLIVSELGGDFTQLQGKVSKANAQLKQLNSSYGKLKSLESSLGSMKISGNYGKSISAGIEEAIVDVKRLQSEYGKLRAMSINGTLSPKALQKFASEAAKAESRMQSLRRAAKIDINFETGTTQSKVEAVVQKMNKLGNASDEVKLSVAEMQTALAQLGMARASGNIEDMVNAQNRLKVATEKATAQIRLQNLQQQQAKDTNRMLMSAQSLEIDKQKFSNEIDIWLKRNSAAAKDFGGRLDAIKRQINSVDAQGLKNLRGNFKLVTQEAELAKKATLSIGDRLKEQATRYAAYFSVASLAFEGMQAIRYMFRNVLELDTAMTGLYRVTDLTASGYEELYGRMTNAAREYGSTLTDIVNATSDWVRAGFSETDAVGLAEITTMYQHISDLEYDEAAENLLTSYNGFKQELKDAFNGDDVAAVSYIGDVLNELDNKFSVTAAGLGEGLSRSASALDIAGNTFQESAAMIGAVTEVTQDPEKAGSAMKILSLRLRGMKGQLQEMGEEVDDNVENISKMQGQILNMTHGKVNIFDDNGEFKSTYEIMDGIAEVYDDLSSIDQANLLETIAGKNRANDVAALISNWSNAEAMLESAMGAEGSAAREHEKYMNSLQGHINVMKASFQELSTTVLKTEFLNGLIDGLTTIINLTNTFIETFGVLPTLATMVGAALSFKGVMPFRVMTQDVSKLSDAFTGFTKNVRIFNTSLSEIGSAFSQNKGLKDGIFSMEKAKSVINNNAFSKQLQTDIDAIRRYQDAFQNDKNIDPTRNVRENMSGATYAAKQFAVSMKDTGKSVDDFAKSTRLSQIAATAQAGGLENARSIINDYNKGLKNTGISHAEFIDTVGQSRKSLGNYLSNVDSGKASLKGYVASLVGAKVATGALQIATMALNAALSMGVMLIVGAAFNALMDWINKADKIAEKAEEIVATFEDQKTAAKDAKKTIDEVGESYAKLSKGVNSITGENMSLSTEEYDEYLDITNQIAESIPSLVRGYDDQGNAILSCSGSVKDLTNAYKEMEKAANDALLSGAGSIIETFENSFNTIKGNKWNDNDFFNWNDDFDLTSYKALSNILDPSANGSWSEKIAKYANWYSDEQAEIVKALEDAGYTQDTGEWWHIADGETTNEFIERVLSEDSKAAQKILSGFETEMEAMATDMRTVAEAHISNAFLSGDYGNISDSMQSMIESMIPNLSFDFFADFIDDDGTFNTTKFYGSLNQMLSTFDSLNENQSARFEMFADLQTRYNNGEVSVNDYLAGVKDIEDVISALPDDIQETVKMTLGIDTNDVQVDKDALVNDLTGELEMASDIAEDFVGSLSSGEMELVFDLVAEGKIDKSMIDEYEDIIDEMKQHGLEIEDLANTTFGNIDTNNRQVLEWTSDNLSKYKDELMSWEVGDNAKSWDQVKKELEGGISTVMGAWDTFKYGDGKTIDIAFSPMLQTESGAELLDNNTVNEYINQLIEKATDKSGNLDINKLMSFDMTGLEIDGRKIQNLLAGVGDEAELAAASMHYFGEDGAVACTALIKELERAEKVAEAMSFTIDITAETEGLEALNTAISESMSGAGLTSESMALVKGRYAELEAQGYDLSDMFEETANGIHLNRRALTEFDQQIAQNKLDDANEQLKTLQEEYQRLSDIINDPSTNASARASAMVEQQNIIDQINNVATLASQYEGLTSAYNKWQNVEAAGQERDMYESIIEGIDTLDNEIGRGWIDDGSIALLELLTGRQDLATLSAKELKKVYDDLDDSINSAGYSIKDFFTVNDDGESTNTGVYNFLETVDAQYKDLEGVIKKNGDGRIIGFDFKVAGGDAAVAEALGVSEELVQIMLRAADDAGFVVNLEGAYVQLAELRTAAESAAKYLRDELKVDIDINATSEEDIVTQFEKSLNLLEQFRNEDGTINLKMDGAQEALDVAVYLQTRLDDLTEPVYMSIDASQVDADFEEPLDKMQQWNRLFKEENVLKISGADTSEIEKSKGEILDYFEDIQKNNPKIAAELGIEDMSREELEAALDTGTIEIPATIDLQVEMNETLRDMVNVALYNAGLIDEKEFKQRVNIELYADSVDTSDVENKTEDAIENVGGGDKTTETVANVDVNAGEVNTSDVEEKVDDAVENAGGDDKSTNTVADVNVEAGDIDISDVADKTKEAIENVGDEKTDVEKSVDLEVKIDEYNELIQNLEDADKDIKIKVAVEGLDQVQELNKNIDLATEIDGDIDNLSEFVDGAKELSELDSTIATYVTAEVNGNVIETPEYMINNLKTFAESAEGLKDVGSPTSNVIANVDGNVISTREEGLDNLKVFSDSAKDVKNIGNVSSSVDANISGNVTGMLEESIDNLKTYSESAKDVDSIGDVTSSVNASIHGNVTGMLEESIDNLKAYSENAANVADIGEVTSSVNASIHGNVTGMLEESIDNLKAYSDSAAEVESIGEVTSSVNASIHGNVTGMLEESIDNLKTYSESASEVAAIGEVTSSVNASIHGNVTGMLEESIDNLKAYSDSAAEVASIGDVSSSVNATVHGNVTGMLEESIDNLKVYSDSADEIASIGDVSSSVNANVHGNVTGMLEDSIDNLKTYTDSAKDVASIGDVSSSVDVSIHGNVTGMLEESIDNLKTYSDSAAEVAGIGDVSSSVNASIHGNVTGMLEESIDNLKAYSDSAKDVASIGDVTSSVDAGISGNVTGMLEESIDNLKAYSDSAKDVASIGDVSSSVNASVHGNVTGMLEESIDNLKAYSESAKDVSSIGDVSSSVNANVNGNVTGMLEESIDNLKVYSDSAKDVSGIGDVSSSVSANISGNVTSKSEESIDNIGVFADNANKLKGVGSPTSTATANVEGNATADKISTLKDFNGIASALKSIGSVVVSVTANIAADAINGAIDLLSRVANGGLFKDYKANVQVTAKVSSVDDTVVQNYQAPSKDGKATYTVDSSKVDVWTAPPKTGTITYSPVVKALTDLQKNKTGTIRYTPIITGTGPAAGTAHAGGSSSAGASGRAFARGDWGIKGNGVALGGELGQELVVRDGRFFTIGDNGAEFFQYKKNDIVFNAAQTESLFKYGGIKGAKPRGTMLASGTAFASGSFPSSGMAFDTGSYGDYGGLDKVSGSTSSKSKSKSSSSSSDASKEAEEFKEKLDWIEIAIDRIERAISKLDLTASSVYKKWSDRNGALADEMDEIRGMIELQEAAAIRYQEEADSVGLSDYWKEKVEKGEIDIETITDEDLADKISEYKEWHEKSLDALEAADEYREDLSSKYAERFDNIITEFEGIIAVAEHEKNMLEEAISQSEAKGRITSTSYYDALIAYEKENQDTLIAQREEMKKQLNENVASGAIKEGSEEWVKEVTAINDVTLAIEESETALLDYAKTMRELEWEQFEALQDRISHITEETEFLIDLMSNDKLYDDKGQLTNEGIATVGLHGVNYNTYMHKADMYGEEAEKAYAAWQADPANKDLEDHYYEMLELRRENILLAEGEVDAYKDIVEEGINIELDALQELIDKKNEALQSEKDAYEYSKKVAEQTKEIAALEKQMAAYSGDDSEETKAKIQELKVSLEEAKTDLEETEYDKYISDQEALLDELYLEYETILNQRLDNVDLLLQSMIDTTNANAATINETLSGVAGGVGTEMSTVMGSIFGTEGENNVANVITAYDKNFGTTMTGVKGAIDGIKAYTDMLKKKADDEAAAKAAKAKESNAAKSKEASGSASTSGSSSNNNNNKNNNNKTTTSGDGKPKIGDKVKFVSGKYYYDSQGKSPLGSKYQGKEVYITNINEKSWATHPYHISTGKKLGSGDLGWLKLNQLSGYATGKKKFLSDELGWTQENGREFIIRPSDGAILTPLAKGDSVLNAAASSNLWNMANNPADFIRDNLSLSGANVHNGSGGQTNVEQNFEKIEIILPNVTSYDEFKRAMQKDKDVERFLHAATVDQLAGKSPMRKRKSIR